MKNQYDIFENEIAPLLERLKACSKPDDDIWSEIWDAVHHQGDVYVSSYIAIPEIFKIYKEKNWLDADLPACFAVIESCRLNENNPKLPDWLENDYFETIHETVKYCANRIDENWSKELLVHFLMLVTILKRNETLYQILDITAGSDYDEKYLLELYDND